jgi:ribosome-binding protein aMBF1 (putative translation factor)
MAVQFLEIGGQQMAVLPVDDYRKLIEIVEDKADLMAAVRAEGRRAQGEEYLRSVLVDRLLDGESALRVWRQHRGLTLDELSKRSGVGKSMLSEIENGNRMGKPVLWRKLAAALDVTLDDIVPEADA